MLGVSNVMANRVLPEAAYVPWNLAVAAGLGWLAHRAGVSASELGLDRRLLGRGVGAGAAAAGLVAVSYGAALAHGDVPGLDDLRATELDPGQAWFQALVRIPLGTVVLEEFAFRGALPALLRAPGIPRWVPATVPSVLFGLWHVLPSQALAGANVAAGELTDRVGAVGTTALAVAGTAAAGGVLQLLRHRAGHLAAPAGLHWAANALGLLAARLAGPA